MTTNNHPAHGPVSLDRLHQIREILSKAAAQSDGGNLGYAMADAVKVIDGAIAAFGAEPVAWMIIDIDTGEKIIRPDRSYFEGPCQPLYAAPQLPQPAVPECFQRLLHHAYGMTMGHDWNKGTMAGHHREKLCKAVEGCRAAMLQAGNSPVTPDGLALVPKRLTAENGAKGVLSGEFSEAKFINCPECFGDDECETGDGSGRIEITVPVSWTNIKAIWAEL